MSKSLSKRTLLHYALFGFPLGFVGLPLYVHLPKYYADTLPLSLSLIGAVMFFTRIADCFADPWIGYFSDRQPLARKRWMVMAAVIISFGVLGLFLLPDIAPVNTQLPLLALLLLVTYLSYSMLSINFYAGGLMLSTDYIENTRISAWREAAIILGVLIASALPPILMQSVGESQAYLIYAMVFIIILASSFLISAPHRMQNTKHETSSLSPFKALVENRKLRWIFALFFINAIPPSITATLFLFFTSDVLKLPEWSGAFLVVYFLCAVLSMPLWTNFAKRVGKRRSLMTSMTLAIISFVGAYSLSAGDSFTFMAICIFSGAALGGDLAVLPSLLADAIDREEQQGGLEFGIWNFISKFTLALAAGIALPTLDMMGYVPGNEDADVSSLSFSYGLLPCIFKLAALGLLLYSPIDKQR